MHSHLEEFRWKELSIVQSEDVLKIGTDAILLGAWIPTISEEPTNVIDVGTGTGVLAMMLSSAFPNATIDAIDIDENAVELSRTNFTSIKNNRLNVWHEDLFKTFHGGSKKYHMVVSNPPYYFNQFKSEVNNKATSKHTEITSELWMKALITKLEKGGHLYIVLPYKRANAWIRTANESGLYCRHRLDVYSFEADAEPVRSLLHLHNALKKAIITKLFIFKTARVYTNEYLEFTGIEFSEK